MAALEDPPCNRPLTARPAMCRGRTRGTQRTGNENIRVVDAGRRHRRLILHSVAASGESIRADVSSIDRRERLTRRWLALASEHSLKTAGFRPLYTLAGATAYFYSPAKGSVAPSRSTAPASRVGRPPSSASSNPGKSASGAPLSLTARTSTRIAAALGFG